MILVSRSSSIRSQIVKFGGNQLLSPRSAVANIRWNTNWHAVKELEHASVETLREEGFKPSLPCLLPRRSFADMPAIGKWFQRSLGGSEEVAMNLGYLNRFGHAMVPLEFTRLPPLEASEPIKYDFMRSKAPLSLFLEWTQHAAPGTLDRLYLAQASFADLPQDLVDDLPAPELVTKVGKGDIYDTNIWIGLSPTYTPLHRDPNPNLFVQLAGSKSVRIVKPEVGEKVFAHVQRVLGKSGSAAFRGEEMMRGDERAMLEDQVWGKCSELSDESLRGYEIELGSGDGLFIPKGWWHSIKGTGKGITASVRYSALPASLVPLVKSEYLGQLVVSVITTVFSWRSTTIWASGLYRT